MIGGHSGSQPPITSHVSPLTSHFSGASKAAGGPFWSGHQEIDRFGRTFVQGVMIIFATLGYIRVYI
jgi:hypothetical protein